MQRNKIIKWGVLAAMLILALSLCAACGNRVSPNRTNVGNDGTEVIEGYIVDFNGDRVTIDQVEFLTARDTSRINDLGLDSGRDFRNGYYVHNDGTSDRQTYTLASNVQVRLADTAMDGWYNGANRNAAINNVGGYTPNNTAVGINRDIGIDRDLGINRYSDTQSTQPKTGVGTVNPAQHVGYSLGGVAGGVLGGTELLSNRYRDGIMVNTNTPYFITIKDGYVTSIEEVSAFSNFATVGYPTTNYTTPNSYSTTGR